jgi:putative endonuclease
VSWTVYILRTASGRLYTGITTDLVRRLAEHRGARPRRQDGTASRAKARGAKALRGDAPRSVAWSEAHPDRSSASRREAAIKRLPRAAKLALIDGGGRGRRATRTASVRDAGR